MAHENKDEFIPWEQRPGWQDIKPIPQDDGELNVPIVSINYTREYKNTMDLIRAVLQKDEKSERVLELLTRAIELAPGNYTLWPHRRSVLISLNNPEYFQKEFEWTERIVEDSPKCYQVWYHRRWLVTTTKDHSHEIEFLNSSIENDSKNYHAWSYRQWVVEQFRHWESEVEYLDKQINYDLRNNSAWNMRFFVFKKSSILKQEDEIEFAFRFISKAPNNESSWNYLKGVLEINFEEFEQKVLDFCLDGIKKWSNLNVPARFLVYIYERQATLDSYKKALDLIDLLINKLDDLHRKYWLYKKSIVEKKSLLIEKENGKEFSIESCVESDCSDSEYEEKCLDFRVGSMIRLSMTRFMTYDYAEVRPGPQLNLVLGPNGSGKSSIVSAMVLALGGKISSLGRSKDLRSFIKYGSENAILEIELKGEPGAHNIVINRFICKDNTSSWRINGAPAKPNDISALAKSFNIRVDNLCQFLPQDRVSAFANMDPVKLLHETELAVGGNALEALHNDLIQLKQEEINYSAQNKLRNQRLSEMIEQNKAMEKEKQRFEEREQSISLLALAKKKRAITIYESQKAKSAEIKAQLDDINKKIIETKEAVAPLIAKQKEARSELSKNNEKTDKLKSSLQEIQVAYSESWDSYNKSLLNVKIAERNLNSFEEMEEKRQEEINKMIKTLKKYKEQYEEDEGKQESFTMKVNVLKSENKDLQKDEYLNHDELRHLRDEMKRLQQRQHQQREDIARKERIEQQKLDLLPQGILNLYNWVNNSDNKVLREKVYGPLLLEISVSDNKVAAILELLINNKFRMAFIAQNEHDRDLLLFESKKYDGTPPMIIYRPKLGKSIDSVIGRNPVPIDELKGYGVTGYVDSLVNAPDIVRDEICIQCNLNMIPYGTIHVERFVEEIFQKYMKIATIVSENYVFHSKRSLYNSNVKHTSVIKLLPAKRLLGNPQKLNYLHDQLKTTDQEFINVYNKVGQIEKRIVEIQDQIRRNREEIASLEQSLDLFKKLKSRIDTIQENIDSNDAFDVKKSREHKIDAVKSTLTTQINLLRSSHSYIPKITKINYELSILLLERFRIVQDLELVDSELNEIRLDDIYETRNALSIQLEDSNKIMIGYEKAAKESAPNESDMEAWGRIPENFNDLEFLIEKLEFKISRISSDNSVILRYESRLEEIKNLQKDLENESEQLELKGYKISELKSTWISRVSEFVEKINENFKSFFNSINCNGKVELRQDDEDMFDKFGIEIHVSFRAQEEMKLLDSRVQSGGERSVATIFYLIALQQISDCPFRLVDEINQGMDPENERAVFDRIVSQANRKNAPQYFLITPKLLANLKFRPNVTVLFIFNGPYILDQSDWAKLTD